MADITRDLTVVFQPIVDLIDGTVVGYEALGRLAGRETEGFLPVLQGARAAKRTQSVFRQLYRLTLHMGEKRPSGSLLFVNVRLGDLGRIPSNTVSWPDVVLEVPESDRRLDQWDARLRDVRALGAQVAIDDWGVGMADPLRLIQLRPQWLKIDVALVHRLGQADVDRLLELLIRWANPETTIIAEGIETPEQIYRLRRLGVRYGQGFGLALPAHDWPRQVMVPHPTRRFADIHRAPLALTQAVTLTDETLALIESARDDLRELLNEAVIDLIQWIKTTFIGHRLAAVNEEQYQRALTEHFHQLTRGYLDPSDIARAELIARTHQRYGVDLSYYVMGYRNLQAFTARRLRGQQKVGHAEALRDLFNWDMSMVMQAYQAMLERDGLTGVLTRQAFWDQVNRDIPEALRANSRWVFGLVDLNGLKRINARRGHMVGDQILTQVGAVLRELMMGPWVIGRMGGDKFGLWLPYRGEASLRSDLSHVKSMIGEHVPGVSLIIGTAVLGTDGTTADALYAAGDRRLKRQQAHVQTHGA